jgi:hypothetical protein
MPETGRTKGVAEQACRAKAGDESVPLTFDTRMQLISGMNPCIALYWAISRLRTALAHGRFSSDSYETHFGWFWTILRGHARWAFRESAEAAISLIRRFVVELALRRRLRPR